MKYNIDILKENYYKGVLLILNQLGLNLTKQEIDIISVMLKENYYTINKQVKDSIIDILNISYFNLNNYIKKLKDKNILVNGDKGLLLNDKLIEKVKDNEIHIIFNIK